MKSVVFLGTKKVGYECLRYLLENSDKLGIVVKGVITAKNERYPEIDLSLLASKHGVSVSNGPEALFQWGPVDFLVSVQFNTILKKTHIEMARMKAVNLHMAPLPEYRGCNQFSYAILEGKEYFGCTLHRLDEGIDSGDIIAEKRFPIRPDITVDQLFLETENFSIALFRESIKSVFDGTCTYTPQAQLESERGTSFHYRKEIENIKLIDPESPVSEIAKKIRATSMPGFEPPHAIVNDQKHYYRLNHAGQPQAYAIGHFPRLQKTGIREVEFGENVLVYEPANMYECKIGSDSVIGPYTEIQRGAVIGNNTKVQSHAFICELVEIGSHCFISHGVMFINDTFTKGGPAGGDRSQWKKTVIGNHVSIGSNATILPVSICDHVVVGAGSVVTKNISEPGTYAGNPAKKIK